MSRRTLPPLSEIAVAFLKLGALSYGGPALFGVMQAEFQEKRGWITKERFLEGLAFVNMLPGPPAVELSIFIGHVRAGWRGAIVAGLAFVVPAFLILLALTLAYSAYGDLGMARDAFHGIAPVVVAIFAVAVYRLGRNALKGASQIAVAAGAAALLALTPLGMAIILLLAACAGVALYHAPARGLICAALVLAAWGALHFLVPDAASADGPPAQPTLSHLAAFFLKTGALTFGGGITVIAFVQQQVVDQLHWLTPREFIDGLALGQFTPGPIVMIAAYVGYKTAGFAGALVSTVAMFLPAFVLILSLAPVLERVQHLEWIRAAMKATSAAVIGCLAVALAHLLPHAVPDAFAAIVLAAAVAALLLWRPGPVPLVLAGGAAGIAARWASLY